MESVRPVQRSVSLPQAMAFLAWRTATGPFSAMVAAISSALGRARSEEHTSELQAHTNITQFPLFFNDTATPEIYTLPLHDALPISMAFLAWRTATGPFSAMVAAISSALVRA